MRRPLLAGLALALAVSLAACGIPSARGTDAPPGVSETGPGTPTGDELTGTLTIYAAASLQASFDELATAFEARHPSLEILPIVYDGSSTLATQVAEGAPADVFAAADEDTMAVAVEAGVVAGTPQLFATNTLVVAVPTGNPGRVTSLADLADPARTVVLCAVEVPCGAAAARLLAEQGVRVTAASLEQNVTAVLTKVAADEADAGLVYATDVRGRADVASIVPDGAADVVNRYPIAALSRSSAPAAASAFLAFVRSADGQKVLAAHGFGAP